TGMAFSISLSSPGSPSTQARCLSGIGKSLLIFTPAGAYMIPPMQYVLASNGDGLLPVAGLRTRSTKFRRKRARGGSNFVAHEGDVLVARPHARCRSADGADHGTRLIADGGADADDTLQEFLAVDGIAGTPNGAQRFDQLREFRDSIVGEALHAVNKDAAHLVLGQPSQHGLAERGRMRRLDLAGVAGIDAHDMARLAHRQRDDGIALQG